MMSRRSTFRGPTTVNRANNDRPQSKEDDEMGMWSSMLNSVASGKKLPEKNIIVLGRSKETMRCGSG